MQNFKQFLTEQVRNYPQLNIWTAMVDEKIPAKYAKQFKAAIEHHITNKENVKVIEASPDSENFYVCIEFRTPEELSYKASRLTDTVRDICEGFGEIEIGQEDIYCEWPPAFPIKAPDYTVNVQLTEPVSSKEISKYIKSTHTLSIQSTKYLTGLLGLLNLDEKVGGIEFDVAGPQFYKAEEIFNKHFNSDRDILECQEDLISAGSKEYAKF